MTRLPFKKQTIVALALCVAATALRGGASDGPRLVEQGVGRTDVSVRRSAPAEGGRGLARSAEIVVAGPVVEVGL